MMVGGSVSHATDACVPRVVTGLGWPRGTGAVRTDFPCAWTILRPRDIFARSRNDGTHIKKLDDCFGQFQEIALRMHCARWWLGGVSRWRQLRARSRKRCRRIRIAENHSRVASRSVLHRLCTEDHPMRYVWSVPRVSPGSLWESASVQAPSISAKSA